MWGFEVIQANAVSKIQEPSLSDRVVLGRECGIAAWLTEAFEALVKNWEPIDALMHEILGWPTYARLVYMRETLWQASVEQISDYVPTMSVPLGKSRDGTRVFTGPGYGREQAKGLRTNSARVAQDIADLVTEQVQEFFLAGKSHSAPGIVGREHAYHARSIWFNCGHQCS